MSWSVRLWSFILPSPWLCLKSSSAFHKVLFLLDLCGFWSFSEHPQMAHFTHSLECSRHLVVSSDQGHFCHLAIANPSPPQSFLVGEITRPYSSGSGRLSFRVACGPEWPVSSWYLTRGSLRAWSCFSFSMKAPVCGMKLDKTHAESWRERALATRLKSRDAAMPNVC